MALVVPTTVPAQTSADPVALIIRTDDIGMSHSVNMAMQKLVSTGMSVSVFSAALKARNVVLLTYRDVIAKEGLKSMRRPVG